MLLPFFLRLDRKGKMVSKKRKANGSDSIDRCLHGINWLSGLGSPTRRNVVLVLGFSLFALAGYLRLSRSRRSTMIIEILARGR